MTILMWTIVALATASPVMALDENMPAETARPAFLYTAQGECEAVIRAGHLVDRGFGCWPIMVKQ